MSLLKTNETTEDEIAHAIAVEYDHPDAAWLDKVEAETVAEWLADQADIDELRQRAANDWAPDLHDDQTWALERLDVEATQRGIAIARLLHQILAPQPRGLARLQQLSRMIAEDLSRAMEHVDVATRDRSSRE